MAGTCGCEPPAWTLSCSSPEKRSTPPTACLTTGDRFLHELSTCSFTSAVTPHLGPQPMPTVTTVQGPSAWSPSSPRAQPQDEGNESRPSAPHPASPWIPWGSHQECTPRSYTSPAHQLYSTSQAGETTQLLFPGSSMAPQGGRRCHRPAMPHAQQRRMEVWGQSRWPWGGCGRCATCCGRQGSKPEKGRQGAVVG